MLSSIIRPRHGRVPGVRTVGSGDKLGVPIGDANPVRRCISAGFKQQPRKHHLLAVIEDASAHGA